MYTIFTRQKVWQAWTETATASNAREALLIANQLQEQADMSIEVRFERVPSKLAYLGNGKFAKIKRVK